MQNSLKYLKNRVRFLEESRDRWKRRAQELKARVKQMEAKEQESEEKLETLEPRGSQKKFLR